MQYDPNAIFYKFRPLEHTDDFKIFEALYNCKNTQNNRVKEILETSLLYAPTFEKLNDVDECVYSFEIGPNENPDEQAADFRRIKNEKYICSFSHECRGLKQDLLWAHYASESRGVRIDFAILPENAEIVNEIIYDSKTLSYESVEVAKEHIFEIMHHKKKCWSYEREYRAVFGLGQFGSEYFPIEIKRIVLGRRINNVTIYKSDDEKVKLLDNTRRIAALFRKTLIDSNKYDEIPEIYAYETMYSPTPKPIDKIQI